MGRVCGNDMGNTSEDEGPLMIDLECQGQE